jgi:succinoglycan biosynthesis protein ExoW
MTENIAVIIPFYQKKTGILGRAVGSALRQAGNFNLRIIVIDDSSPVPAKSELAELMRDNPGRIVIIEQPNGGPAAARNNGLDHVPPGTNHVAFLDSDDEWIPQHIANAMVAMGAGFDFYFSDHFQLNQTISAFKRAGRIDVARHPRVEGAKHVRAYVGDMFDQILTGNIIGTSTVVYRFASHPALRFREEFVYAGEDYLFWLELSKLTSKIAFSSLCECVYGEGVNIFAGSGWGTEKSLDRLHYEIKFKKALPRLFELNDVQLVANRRSVKTLRRSFVTDLLHRAAHRIPINRSVLKSHFRVDPQSFYFAPFLAIRIACKTRS